MIDQIKTTLEGFAERHPARIKETGFHDTPPVMKLEADKKTILVVLE